MSESNRGRSAISPVISVMILITIAIITSVALYAYSVGLLGAAQRAAQHGSENLVIENIRYAPQGSGYECNLTVRNVGSIDSRVGSIYAEPEGITTTLPPLKYSNATGQDIPVGRKWTFTLSNCWQPTPTQPTPPQQEFRVATLGGSVFSTYGPAEIFIVGTGTITATTFGTATVTSGTTTFTTTYTYTSTYTTTSTSVSTYTTTTPYTTQTITVTSSTSSTTYVTTTSTHYRTNRTNHSTTSTQYYSATTTSPVATITSYSTSTASTATVATTSSVTTITSTVTSTVTTVTTSMGGVLLILLVLALAAYLFPTSLVIRLSKQSARYYDSTLSLQSSGCEFEEPEV